MECVNVTIGAGTTRTQTAHWLGQALREVSEDYEPPRTATSSPCPPPATPPSDEPRRPLPAPAGVARCPRCGTLAPRYYHVPGDGCWDCRRPHFSRPRSRTTSTLRNTASACTSRSRSASARSVCARRVGTTWQSWVLWPPSAGCPAAASAKCAGWRRFTMAGRRRPDSRRCGAGPGCCPADDGGTAYGRPF